jgi:ATP-binding cassette subfamily G (WHITE) protein 2 (SNQ2)
MPRRNSTRSKRNSMFSIKKAATIEDEEEGEQTSNIAMVDLEEYLQRTVREREASGIIPKKIGVSFQNLTVSGVGSGWVLAETFPQGLVGLFGGDIVQFVRGLFRSKPQPKKIIHDFSGVVKPGEMLLVLGKPGSGSSTFLRALTNQPREATFIEGKVHYSGLSFELAKGKYRGEILYNDEGWCSNRSVNTARVWTNLSS